MKEEMNRDNCRLFLAAFMEENNLSVRDIADAVECSEATINRILANKTHPSDEFMKQTGIMIEIGFQKYSHLSQSEKEQISEVIGTIGGGILGFGSISAAISTMGIGGLSAAGITSGLAAIGALVGGGMVAGVTVAAAIPIAAGAAGYAIIKAVKFFVTKAVLDSEEIDLKWEVPFRPGEDEAGATVPSA